MFTVRPITSQEASTLVVEHHYLHRRTNIWRAFGLFDHERIVGVVTFGVPASRHLQIGACPSNPDSVVELNRLWVNDECPRNTESWFVRRVLAVLPPRIVVSYADTSQGHVGIVYRATGFKYAGWTDMDRKTPRFDYVVPGRHSREAFRSGTIRTDVTRVRRKPKIKYWEVTGNRRERRDLVRACGWPSLDWRVIVPPV